VMHWIDVQFRLWPTLSPYADDSPWPLIVKVALRSGTYGSQRDALAKGGVQRSRNEGFLVSSLQRGGSASASFIPAPC
jgi:hypothetical protein